MRFLTAAMTVILTLVFSFLAGPAWSELVMYLLAMSYLVHLLRAQIAARQTQAGTA